MFAIDEDTGDISTVSDIDREFMSVHYFKVTGVGDDPGGSGSKQTATTTLQISVKDVNDNAPKFENQVYNASVRESLPIGSSMENYRVAIKNYMEIKDPERAKILTSNKKKSFNLSSANIAVVYNQVIRDLHGSD